MCVLSNTEIVNTLKNMELVKLSQLQLSLIVFTILIVTLGIVGCGGGGDNSGNSGSTVNQSPGGIWQGTITSTDTGTNYQSIGFITGTGELRFLVEDREQTVGQVSVNGTTFSANLTAYAPLGKVFTQNGQPVI
jgi:hypothetical protein